MMIKQKNGFTLIELCVVMVIIGLLVAGMASAYSIYMQKMQVTDTKSHINEAVSAIAAFHAENGYFPCPARGTDPAAAATNCATAITGAGISSIATGVTGHKVRTGVLPMSVRNKDGEMVQLVTADETLDGYKNRLAYAVIESMAVSAAATATAGNGSIRIRNFNAPGSPITLSKYVVLSHGVDGAGAYTATGILKRNCVTGNVDGENCDGTNPVFADNGQGARSFKGDANNYDDFIVSQSSGTPTSCGANQIVISVDFGNQTIVCGPASTGGTGTCPAGQQVTAVNFANGTVVCAPAVTNGTVIGSVMLNQSISHASQCQNLWGDMSCSCNVATRVCSLSCATSTPRLLMRVQSAMNTGSNEPMQPTVALFACVANGSGTGGSTTFTFPADPHPGAR